MRNVAVEDAAITAITPAWTASVTIRSAASGADPAMLSEMTSRPRSLTSRTAVSMSPPIKAPANTRTRTRGKRAQARTAWAMFSSPSREMVSTEMRSPR